ncbi:stage V sporulation protein AA [Aeribacillus pallidus]|nr:stage V sporulation protein AA [Aeribacillus pallidus]
MNKTVYVRLKHRIQAKPNERITLNKIAKIIADEALISKMGDQIIHQIQSKDKTYVVIDVINVIEKIQSIDPSLDVQPVGPTQTIVEIQNHRKKFAPILFFLVWLLLFVGSALTIMNFHEDVSMQRMHRNLYQFFTGNKIDKPLILQIPYSIGLGLGMVLFFNHVFKKKFNEEPSPLEVEIFNYQMDLDQYIAINENKESVKNDDD